MARFADRDMIMRYHWGLAVGHVYAHEKTTDAEPLGQASDSLPHGYEGEEETHSSAELRNNTGDDPDRDPDEDNPEFGFENDEDGWLDDQADDSEDEGCIERDDELADVLE